MNDAPLFAHNLWVEQNSKWKQLAAAFYGLAHNDPELWNALPVELRQTDVGLLCEAYLRSRDWTHIDQAGKLLAGPDWYTALGR
ncbi:hypothetical protein [Paucibacter sp. M5-1]|uniref:hypothetical protein n=1 Tax=Paucibacter sp. M5-1 TaxID=3015998 RepID=UPI0022B8DE19|nr:hypothetical protein [Paucibacter sp. M5-1]MCZ7881806.1 hypothetical protein [Paucibacter sp. M5-1]